MVLSFLLFAGNGWGATYYVDQTGGNDGNAGTSTGAAWKTAGKVSGTTFAAGDRILFKRGEVWRDAVLSVHNSGSAGNVITYGAYGSGANPLINGADVFTSWTSEVVGVFTAYYKTSTINPRIVMQNTTRLSSVASKAALTVGTYWWDDPNDRVYVRTTGDNPPSGYTMQMAQRPSSTGLIQYNGKSYITIDGIDAIYSRDFCIHNYPGGAGQTTLVAKNLTTSYSWGGQISFGSDAQWVTNITVDNVTVSEANIGNPGGNEAITFQYSDGCELKNSTIHDFYQEAVDMKLHTKNCNIHNNHIYNRKSDASYTGPAVYLDGADGNIEIYNNRIHGIPGDYNSGITLGDEIGAGALNNVSIHNNLIYDAGIGMEVYSSDTGEVSNLNIYNNTFAGLTLRAISYNSHLLGNLSGTNNVKNNIFWLNGSDIVDSTTANAAIAATTISHNLFKTGYSSETIGTNSVVTSTSPFKNYGTYDFALAAGSPAINAGVSVGLTTDYAGSPILGLSDIGAYEYTSPSPKILNTPAGIEISP